MPGEDRPTYAEPRKIWCSEIIAFDDVIFACELDAREDHTTHVHNGTEASFTPGREGATYRVEWTPKQYVVGEVTDGGTGIGKESGSGRA